MAASCNVDEATLVRPARFAMHDAAELDDSAALARLLALEEAEAVDDSLLRPDVSVDKNERDHHGCTPVHVAALNAAGSCFRLLLDKGVKTNLKCNGSPLGHILLAMAAIPSNAAFVREACTALLAIPQYDLLASDDTGRTWLHAAAASGAVEAARLFADKTPSIVLPALLTAVDKQARTALHVAAAGRHAAFFDWLLPLAATHGSDAALLRARDATGNSAAHAAGKAGWAAGVDRLVAAAESSSATAGASAMQTDGAAAADAPLPDEPASAPAAAAAAAVPPAQERNWTGLTPAEELAMATGQHVAVAACLSPRRGASSGDAASASSASTAAAGAGAGAAPSAAAASTSSSGPGSSERGSGSGTLILTHAACKTHRTCAPVDRRNGGIPPENTARLDTLLHPVNGTLRQQDIAPALGPAAAAHAAGAGAGAGAESAAAAAAAASTAPVPVRLEGGAPPVQVADVLRVHEYGYVRRLLHAVGGVTPEGEAGGAVSTLDGDTAVSR